MLANTSENQSPPEAHLTDSEQNRKRKTFSCHSCRRKKLKCDRGYPSCGRCRRSGTATTCVYDARLSDSDGDTALDSRALPEDIAHLLQRRSSLGNSVGDYGSYGLPFVNDLLSLVQRQAGRIAILEDRLDQQRETTSAFPGERNQFSQVAQRLGPSINFPRSHFEGLPAASGSATFQDGKAMLFQRTGHQTQYFGASNPLSICSNRQAILKNYPEFKIFMGDPTKHSQALLRARNIAISLKEKYNKEKTFEMPHSVQNLIELLPGREEVERLTRLYWDVMESTHRILHGPTFRTKYRNFWEMPSSAGDAFVAILVLVVASVRCMDPKQPVSYSGLSSINRQDALASIEACEAWLSRQNGKLLTMETVQIRVLLYVAKRANGANVHGSWEEASSLLNYAVAVGLHRDPILIDKSQDSPNIISSPRVLGCEKEMRRRLWATIVEIELQAAFDRGLLSSSNSLSGDCEIPSNIDDAGLEEVSDHPPSKPWESYTSSSFLHISSRSLALRSNLNKVINDPKTHISYDELLSYQNRIMDELEGMPQWVDSQKRSDSVISPSALPAFHLDIQLRQFILSLHLPYAQRVGTDWRYSYSRMVCIDTAYTILEHHWKLASSGIYTLNFLREDVFRAALALCHSIISGKAIQSDRLAQGLSPLIPQQVEKGLALLEEKMLRVGEQYFQLFFLSAGYGMLRTASARDELNANLQSIIQRLTRLFEKIINSQGRRWDDSTASIPAANTVNPGGEPDEAFPLQVPEFLSIPLAYPNAGGVEMTGWQWENPLRWNSTPTSWLT